MSKLLKNLSVIMMLVLSFSLTSITVFAQDDGDPLGIANVEGEAIDSAAIISWSEASDPELATGYKVYYGTEPVVDEGDDYEFNEDAGDTLEYTVENLNNGTTYYFSVIAYDAEGGESVFWSEEVAVTPTADTENSSDLESPQVVLAETISSEEVRLTFSEEIVLPEENPELAFTIEDQEVFEPLIVLEAKMDEEDSEGKSVILITEVQTLDRDYKVTVQLDVTDLAGNPIVSGTSDTAMFKGSDIPMESHESDSTPPIIISLETLSSTNVYVQFDEAIVVDLETNENFEIIDNNNADNKLEILGVELGVNDEGIEDASALITTSEQSDIEYLFRAIDVKDMAGNKMDSTDSRRTFMGIAGENSGDDMDTDPDTDEPENNDDDNNDTDVDTPAAEKVANLIADKVFDASKYDVDLHWTILDENINAQKLYKKMSEYSDYDLEASLDAETTEYTVEDLEAGNYWFKVNAIDSEGIEHEGVETKVTLAETGPEIVGLLFLSIGASGLIRRKKEKK